MRSTNGLALLLIESDAISRKILLGQIRSNFPDLTVDASTTPAEALRMLQAREHDIVLCDAILARDERIRFTWKMCSEADPMVIIITADTDLKKESFPPPVKDVCVQQVAYKPLDLQELMQKIRDTVEQLKARSSRG